MRAVEVLDHLLSSKQILHAAVQQETERGATMPQGVDCKQARKSKILRHCGHRPVSASAKHRSSTVQVTCHLEYIFFILLHVNLR